MTTLDLFAWKPPITVPARPVDTGLRYYQREAVEKGVKCLQNPKKDTHGVIVLPTGAGKSHVIGAISSASGTTCVLQPSKEILEQNFRKIKKAGEKDVGIYSASFGSKAIRKITCATIGSVYKNPELFSHFDNFIVDECDVVNPSEGMYKNFFDAIGKPVLGLTASPWRLSGGRIIGEKQLPNKKRINIYSGGSNTIITRSKPRFFTDIIHVTQIGELYDHGYLCPVEYREGHFEQLNLTLNKTGNEYTDATFKRISSRVIPDAFKAVQRTQANHHFVFVRRVEDAVTLTKMLNNCGIPSAYVTGDMDATTRDSIISRFKKGILKCVVNVEVLTVGFDFPALDHIVFARPTASARLYYQMLGRLIRIFDGKEFGILTDLVGNVNRFGRIEDWILEDPDNDGKWRLKSGDRYLTGVDLKNGNDLEKPQEMQYCNKPKFNAKKIWKVGKYKDYPVDALSVSYLRWFIQNSKPSLHRKMAMTELERRGLTA